MSEEIARPLGPQRQMTTVDLNEARHAALMYNFLGYAFDFEKRIRYDFVERVGIGEFGDIYSATSTGEPPPDWLIKTFNIVAMRGNIAEDSEDLHATPIEVEYGMGQTIRRRLDENFCNSSVVCAVDRFYDNRARRGYITFRLVAGLELEAWLVLVQYRAMRDYLAALHDAGFQSIVHVREARDNLEAREDLSRSMRAVARRYRRLYDSLAQRFSRIQMLSLVAAYQILNTFDELHGASVYHRDIKPANMLVERASGTGEDEDDIQMRVINFGHGCAEQHDHDALFEEMRGVLLCPITYETTPLYRDPLANTYMLGDNDSAEEIESNTAKMEIYSLGKVLQRMFDPDSVDERGGARWITIRRTGFMPEGLHELIVDMTGENGYRPPDGEPPSGLRSSERIRRQRNFNRRPSIAQVVDRFEDIQSAWGDTNDNEIDDLQ